MKKYGLVLTAAAFLLVGCTQSDQTRARQETREAGAAIERAGDKVADGAKEAWKDTKEGAKKLGDKVEDAGDKTAEKTKKAGRKAKREAHDATH